MENNINIILFAVAGLLLLYVLFYLLVLTRPKREKSKPQTLGAEPSADGPGSPLQGPALARLDTTVNAEPILSSIQKNGIALAFASNIGARKSQQDSVSCDLDQTKAVAVVCDGMGGMADGDKASKQAASIVFQRLWEMKPDDDPATVLRNAALEADRAVYGIGEAAGMATEVGTTLVAIRASQGKVFWVSVGDSRIYVLRSGQLHRLTTDHIYLMELLELAGKGSITRDEALSHPDREALTSFIGEGGPEYVDVDSFLFVPGDVVLLCSDGLYKSVKDDRIAEIIHSNSGKLDVCAGRLISEALLNGGRRQDNTTVALLRYDGQL